MNVYDDSFREGGPRARPPAADGTLILRSPAPAGPGPDSGAVTISPWGRRLPEGPVFPEDPEEPWTDECFERLLMFLKEAGMSDLVLCSGVRAQARIDGVWRRVTDRVFTTAEVAGMLDQSSGNRSASSLILSGLEQDYSFEAGERRSGRVRFRVNASAVTSGWGTGISLSLRLIPALPPALEELGLEPDLEEHLFPDSGLVLVTGVMGSGKSTFLASVLRRITELGGRRVVTYEAPVEFDLGRVPGRRGPSEQSEVPRHAATFAGAVRNLTRRAADVVLVGESRDAETLRGVLEASELGIAVYTTAHTRSVSETPTRILNVFSASERKGAAAALFSSIRAVVQQRLFPRPGGGRHAVREYLAFDEPMRNELLRSREKALPLLLEAMVRERGMPLLQALEREVLSGMVDPECLKSVRREKGKAAPSVFGAKK